MTLPQSLHKRIRLFSKSRRRLDDQMGASRVHEFRIACRSLIACYPLLKYAAPERHWKHFVKDALASLNELRDLHQLRKRLLKDQSLQPAVIDKLMAQPVRTAESRWHRFKPELQSPALTLALVAIEKSLLSPSIAADGLQAAWRHEWKKSLHAVRDDLQTADETDLDRLHRLRVRYKKLRYLLELWMEVKPNFPTDSKKLGKWQKLLGDISDYRAMADIARELHLPGGMEQQFRDQAARLARRFLNKRDKFAAFLNDLDRRVNASRK